jgi:hypothetical protein
MARNLANRFSCVVCGLEAKRHVGWLLVAENRWLDSLKILSWHPLLAQQASMQSVCGKSHLKTLLTHWLTHANLQFLATGSVPWTLCGDPGPSETDSVPLSVGKLVGELSVHRESLSRVWTGSREALEGILDALTDGMETEPRTPEFVLRGEVTAYSPEYALP